MIDPKLLFDIPPMTSQQIDELLDYSEENDDGP